MQSILDSIDKNLSYEHQFDAIRNSDWGDENPQVDLFCNLLPSISSPNPSMIEIGSGGVHGSFYSILFEKFFKRQCKIINIEPREHLINDVSVMWKDKHLQDVVFYHGYVGTPMHIDGSVLFDSSHIQQVKIGNILEENNIPTLDILHADIQGSEMSLCEELQQDNMFHRIRYIFISSHFERGSRRSTHQYCKDIISKSMNCKIHFDDVNRGGCGDGLLVVENINYAKQ